MAVVTQEVEKTITGEIHGDGTAQPAADPAAWLTVEHVGYVAALVIGVLLRVWGLGDAPLLPVEAANSWPAYLAAQARTVADAPVPTSALLYGAQWLVFWIGANGDAAARAVSAGVGGMLVLWPWLWRGWIGRGA